MMLRVSANPSFDDLIGKVYERGGRGPDAYDCFGLVMEAYRRFGIALPDYGYAVEAAEIERMIEAFASGWEEIPPGLSPLPPSVVTFRIRHLVTHLGVVIARDRFIHVLKGTQVSIERLSNAAWQKRISGYYRWKD